MRGNQEEQKQASRQAAKTPKKKTPLVFLAFFAPLRESILHA
jgi:hypothetical protein